MKQFEFADEMNLNKCEKALVGIKGMLDAYVEASNLNSSEIFSVMSTVSDAIRQRITEWAGIACILTLKDLEDYKVIPDHCVYTIHVEGSDKAKGYFADRIPEEIKEYPILKLTAAGLYNFDVVVKEVKTE